MSKKVRSNISKEKLRNLSPFLNAGKGGLDLNNVNTIVLHWTGGGSLNGTILTLRQSVSNNGYHFIIEQDGTITQTLPLSEKANHGGYSFGPNGKFTNSNSYGISMVGNEKDFEKVNEDLMDSLTLLIKDIIAINPNIKFLTGHHEIAPGRKVDPYNFDFVELLKRLDNKLTYWKAGDAPYTGPVKFTSGGKVVYTLDAKNVTRDKNKAAKISNPETKTEDTDTAEDEN